MQGDVILGGAGPDHEGLRGEADVADVDFASGPGRQPEGAVHIRDDAVGGALFPDAGADDGLTGRVGHPALDGVPLLLAGLLPFQLVGQDDFVVQHGVAHVRAGKHLVEDAEDVTVLHGDGHAALQVQLRVVVEKVEVGGVFDLSEHVRHGFLVHVQGNPGCLGVCPRGLQDADGTEQVENENFHGQWDFCAESPWGLSGLQLLQVRIVFHKFAVLLIKRSSFHGGFSCGWTLACLPACFFSAYVGSLVMVVIVFRS